MNVINVESTIELKGCLSTHILAIKDIFSTSNVEATIEEDVIFLNCLLDNSNKFVESLAVFISHRLPIGHDDIIFEITGDSIIERYDIVIRKNKVYIRYYELAPLELERYVE